MSLYSDLTEVLTPYANKIKEIDGSLDQLNVSNSDSDGIYLQHIPYAQSTPKYTANGALVGDGTRTTTGIGAGRGINVYSVTAGDSLYLRLANVEGAATYQWQSEQTIPTSVQSVTALIGAPVFGAVDKTVVVPNGATHLAISKLAQGYYLNVVKKVTASRLSDRLNSVIDDIDSVKKDIGASITRLCKGSDLEVMSGEGEYDIVDGELIAVDTNETDVTNDVIKFNNVIAVDYEIIRPGTTPGFIRVRDTASSVYRLRISNSSQRGLTGFFVNNNSLPNSMVHFETDEFVRHIHIEKKPNELYLKMIGTSGGVLEYSVPYGTFNSSFEATYISITNIRNTQNAGNLVANGDNIIGNVVCQFDGSGSEVDYDSKLHGMKWTVFGDSISNSTTGTGHYMDMIAEAVGMRNFGTYPSSSENGYNESNPYPTDDRDLVNLAVSGWDTSNLINTSTDKTPWDDPDIYENVREFIKTCDIITVAIGVNDKGHNRTIEEYKQNIQAFIDWLIEMNPTARIGYITPHKYGDANVENTQGLVLKDYVDAMLEVCGDNSIPCLDMFRNGNFYGDRELFQDIVYGPSDNIHPNAYGHLILAKAIRNWMENVLV